MTFLLPEHVIKSDLIESVKHSISNLTAEQLFLSESGDLQFFPEETHAILPLPRQAVWAQGRLCAGTEPCSDHPLEPASPASLCVVTDNRVIITVPEARCGEVMPVIKRRDNRSKA